MDAPVYVFIYIYIYIYIYILCRYLWSCLCGLFSITVSSEDSVEERRLDEDTTDSGNKAMQFMDKEMNNSLFTLVSVLVPMHFVSDHQFCFPCTHAFCEWHYLYLPFVSGTYACSFLYTQSRLHSNWANEKALGSFSTLKGVFENDPAPFEAVLKTPSQCFDERQNWIQHFFFCRFWGST
jgi:hypothetical protein